MYFKANDSGPVQFDASRPISKNHSQQILDSQNVLSRKINYLFLFSYFTKKYFFFKGPHQASE